MLAKIPPLLLHWLVVMTSVVASSIVLSVVEYAMQWAFSPVIELAMIAGVVAVVTSELPTKYRAKQPLPAPRSA